MEAYLLNAPNFPERKFKLEFKNRLGQEALHEFEQAFYTNFINESDLSNIKELGFNCVRLPFNYRLLGEDSQRLKPEGIAWLDKVIEWAEKQDLWIILDLHATYGCQNQDWHGDSYGEAELWTDDKKSNKDISIMGDTC